MTVHYHRMPDGRRIAYRFKPGTGPTLVFLPGYMSDMTGTKAEALMEWAWATDRSCLLLDYSGCGASLGNFAEGTLTRWRDEVLAVIAKLVRGPVLLVGSSMGGWLMLLVARALARGQIAGLIGIAAAPDFTDWGFTPCEKADLAAGQTITRPHADASGGLPTHAGFWADGQSHCLLDGIAGLDCPVRLLHGQADADVPWAIALRLAAALRSDQVQVTLVKDGDHRLSRAEDLDLLFATIAALEPDRASYELVGGGVLH